MAKTGFKPLHINATIADLAGNNGIGRYIFLPGSNGRAAEIAKHFDKLVVNEHPRGHHLYLGTIYQGTQAIDVAAISSGMGCPSMEIILHELFQLGGKRFLRVGTAGSLQPNISIGDIVNAQASVRDEGTTKHYLPKSFPAIASIEMLDAINQAANDINLSSRIHTGIVHCKSSFYAREFGSGPTSDDNLAYMQLLTKSGVLATEMETAALFIQSQLYNYQLMQLGKGPDAHVLWGAMLGILVIPPHEFATTAQEKPAIHNLTELALTTIKALAKKESATG